MSAPRSYLFVPGNQPERIAKALASGADAVIVDLEDAVPPGDKDSARACVAAALPAARPVLLRINGALTPWFEADRALCSAPGIAGIVLPKAESAATIRELHADNGRPVLPTVESAKGLAEVYTLAGTPGTLRLIFGSLDLRLDLGIPGDEPVLDPYRLQLVLASRLAGLPPPVDGVTTDFADPAVAEADARRSAALGFTGKLCIHPRQIGPVHRGLAPSPAEITWAQRVTAADAAAAGQAVALGGQMVDRPVVDRAHAILARAASRPDEEARRPT
ncbi:CoA ester lyase [Algiphilus sp. W345]|uniref:CoA ester lyase n=1 Tax=Banduia mediterranea TaxID=3075609 RepID=A0ABU2WET4_9GAMM|nr:CoA ester lyase [Algiphilus sp. W345]MDT0496380.1 CoA ester lyase [Algiphilus sp. W345]